MESVRNRCIVVAISGFLRDFKGPNSELNPRGRAGLLQFGARILRQCCNTNLGVLVLLMGGAGRVAARIEADGRGEGAG